jgi:hypothetical protein
MPVDQTVASGAAFTTEIHVNSGEQELAAYGIAISYDETILSIESDDDVVEGADGFISAVNVNDPGVIKTSGFDVGGVGPGADLHLLTINWDAIDTGTVTLVIEVDSLADPDTNPIGAPAGFSGTVTIK